MLWGQTITSRTNARVKALRAALHGKAVRPGELVGLEGWNLIEEAHRAGERFETIYLREGSEQKLGLQKLAELRATERVLLSADVFDGAVETETPQGIAATWAIHEIASAAAEPAPVLLLEDVQDPGNVGTLIRSAAAFGCREVIASPGSAGTWNQKTMRASAGAVFRIPVRRMNMTDAIATLRDKGVRIVAAVAPGSGGSVAASYDSVLGSPCAILIGNEGAGLSPQTLELADARVTIPCLVESLNAAVAGSILLYEMSRQQSLREAAIERRTAR